MATAETFTEIMVSWAAVPLMDQNGVITMYEVRYESVQTGSITTLNVTAGSVVHLINLPELGDYNISLRAYNMVGEGPYSEGVTVTIPPPGKYQ